jgi:hypothetical protein
MKSCLFCWGTLLLGTFVLRAATLPNDNFSSAAVIASSVNSVTFGSNEGASKEVGEPDHADNSGGQSVWWKWIAPENGSVIIETTGSNFDTLLAIYTGSSLATLVPVASNDDNGPVLTSRVGFNVTQGAIYDIAVDGYNGASGNIVLTVTFRDAPLVRPVNDNFASRIPLWGVYIATTGANYFASKEPGEPNHAEDLGGASVWWTWTPPISGIVTINTEGSNFDTILGVYTGSILTNLTAVASSDDVSTNDPTSTVTFAALANVPYQIAVDGYDGEPGDIQLEIAMTNVIWIDALKFQTNGVPALSLTAVPQRLYAFETSTDLLSWTTFPTLTNTNGRVNFVDLAATNAMRKFYRAREVPEAGN